MAITKLSLNPETDDHLVSISACFQLYNTLYSLELIEILVYFSLLQTTLRWLHNSRV